MKIVPIRGLSTEFLQAHKYSINMSIMGLYVASSQRAYIFVDEIKEQAKLMWIMTMFTTSEFNGHKGLQRFTSRLRSLVLYHEYCHHLQYIRDPSIGVDISPQKKFHNEHVCDRYARLKFFHDHKRPVGIKFDRRNLNTQEVLG